MNKYKLVIFDMDGTLADTSPGIFNSIRYVQKKMSLPEITYEQLYSHVGPPMDESYHRNFGLTDEKLLQAVSLHKEYAINNGYKELKFYDGIVELLQMLRASGYKTAVATLKAHSTMLKILESYNINQLFDVVIGVTPDKKMSKADMLIYCIRKIGCMESEALLIGDSEYDAIGAEEVNIDFLGVTYGFGFKNKDDVNKYHNIGYANSPSNIFAVIEKW